MNYKRYYGWDYPPRDPHEAVKEMVEYSDDIAVMRYKPEELAIHLISSIDHDLISPVAKRLSNKYLKMHGENHAMRFQQIINEGTVVYDIYPIDWRVEDEP